MPEENPEPFAWARMPSRWRPTFMMPSIPLRRQARAKPPARDLLRLTIPQFRSSVMDLVGQFYKGPGFDRPIGPEQGLKGFYRGFEHMKPGEKLGNGTQNERAKNRTQHKFDRVGRTDCFPLWR